MTLNPSVNHAMYEMLDGTFSGHISLAHQKRFQAYRNYWAFYLGKHWSYSSDAGETELTFNYCRKIVDLHTNFTFKKGFKTVIPDDPATPEDEKGEREFVRAKLEETWEKNQKELLCVESGQQGGVAGDVFFRVSWEEEDVLEDPYARVDIIPSHFCLPDFGGASGTDVKKLSRMLILIPTCVEVKTQNIKTAFFTRTAKPESSLKIVFQIEEWTNPVLDEAGNQIVPAMQSLYQEDKLLWTKENPLGEIPIVHVSNYPLSGEYYGISDLVDAVELNTELNEKATDISDIINYHGSPTTILTGAKISQMEKGSNRIWSLPEGATVSNLALDGDLHAANTHYDTLKNTLLELTSTPKQALGELQGISNTPGVTLQLQYLPMIDKRDIKILSYGLGFRLINRLILKYTELAEPEFAEKMNKLKGNKYRNKVVFPDPMPQDEARELELARQRLDSGLSHIAKELEKSGYSQHEVEAIIQGAIDDAKRAAEALLEYGGDPLYDNGSGSGNAQASRGGSVETRGAKISDTAAKKDSVK